MSDTNKNPELKIVEPKETEGKKKKTDLTEDVKPAPPSSIYQVLMATMTPEKMANMNVHLVQVNSDQLFWMTSVGQLYAFADKKKAIEAEYTWLMFNPNNS